MKKGIMGFSLAIAFLVMLIHVGQSSAVSWKVKGGDHKGCGGGGGGAVDDCLIGSDWDAEFSLDSHAGRMLYDLSQSVTGKTGNGNQASVNCPTSQGYRSCLPSSNGGGPRQQCGTYTRSC